MNSMISQHVRRIMADLFSMPLGQISAERLPDLVSWDSIQHLNFVLSVEQEFGVAFRPEEIESINSVRGMIDTLENKLTIPSK